MKWPTEFDGAHSVKQEEPDLTLAYMVGAANEKEAARIRLESIADRIEALAAEQTTYEKQDVAKACAAIVRGTK